METEQLDWMLDQLSQETLMAMLRDIDTWEKPPKRTWQATAYAEMRVAVSLAVERTKGE